MENKQIKGIAPIEILLGLTTALSIMKTEQVFVEAGIITYEESYKMVIERLEKSIKDYEELYG